MTVLDAAPLPRLAATYRAGVMPRFVRVPPQTFVVLDGVGAPHVSPAWQRAVPHVLAVSFAVRHVLGPDVSGPVMPLECRLSGPAATSEGVRPASAWAWTLMVALPPVGEEVTDAALDTALAEARALAARRCGARAVSRVEVRSYAEGRSAQLLHVGTLGPKQASVDVLRRFMAAQLVHPRGRYHEIYLADPRRTTPPALQTIIRHAVA